MAAPRLLCSAAGLLALTCRLGVASAARVFNSFSALFLPELARRAGVVSVKPLLFHHSRWKKLVPV
jgi:hypothetical protein